MKAWTLEEAVDTLRHASELVHLPHDKALVLRFGQNAIFHLQNTPYVVRVARPGTDRKRLETELAFAHFLERMEFPAIAPSKLSVDQPIQVGQSLVTFWPYIPQDEEAVVDYSSFGLLLRQLHRYADQFDKPLPPWNPLRRVTARLKLFSSGGTDREKYAAALEEWRRRLDGELLTVRSQLGNGPIHGDAHTGNTLMTSNGLVLLDYEEVCWGPREWDLIPTAVRLRRFGLDPREFSRFSDAYGLDVRGWKYYELLARIRELAMTVWLLQNVDHSAAIAEEVVTRIGSLHEEGAYSRWTPF
jgi:Ser/Thr protein kinase RdoA (MazF antagonist)